MVLLSRVICLDAHSKAHVHTWKIFEHSEAAALVFASREDMLTPS
jgi:hypothetical protein